VIEVWFVIGVLITGYPDFSRTITAVPTPWPTEAICWWHAQHDRFPVATGSRGDRVAAFCQRAFIKP
jgi:hypothetical protein